MLRTCGVSANHMQMWLTQYGRGDLNAEETAVSGVAECEAKVAAIECKIGQSTMELDLVTKSPKPRPVGDNATSSIVSGPYTPRSWKAQMIKLARSKLAAEK
jgi:transposase